MKYFLQYILKHPLLVIFTIVIVLLGGVYSIMNMPVNLFPNLEVPVVNIITHYPAASSKDIELLVSRPIEEQMRAIPGINRVASTSIQGISQISVQFTWGTAVNDARQAIQSQLSQLTGILPSGVVFSMLSGCPVSIAFITGQSGQVSSL